LRGDIHINFKDSEVTVVIPCLNESETLGRCIQEAQAAFQQAGVTGTVIVADGGSTDASKKIALDAGAVVVDVPDRGYGLALHHGILAAKSKIVIFGDADLSYPFSELGKLIRPIVDGEADIVLGSRLLGDMEPHAMPFLNRRLGTPMLSFLVRRLYGLPTTDCNSGLRAILRSKYEQLDMLCPGMEYASEMLIKVAQRKLTYAEVPITFRKDQRSKAPHLRRWRDGWRHLRFIIGNAPAFGFVLVPGTVGILFLLIAFLLSLRHGITTVTSESLKLM